jgi:hypothetical protein
MARRRNKNLMDLQLLESVELRLALADTDEKFQSSVATFLVPVLLKFVNPDVRQKIMDILRHILTRVKASQVKLPVEPLLVAYKSVNPLVKSFSLMFLEIGLSRIDFVYAFDLGSRTAATLAVWHPSRVAEYPKTRFCHVTPLVPIPSLLGLGCQIGFP